MNICGLMNAARRCQIRLDPTCRIAIQREGNRIAMGVLKRTFGGISSASGSMSGC
jgi:hypothetical protein